MCCGQQFILADSNNTYTYTYNTSALAANRNITLPALGQDDTLVFVTQGATLVNKTLITPIIASILSNGYTLTLPSTTNDTLIGRTTTDSLSNKTIPTDTNIIKHSTTNNAGELLVNTGTKFDRFGVGTANQSLAVNGTATGLTWVANAAGASVSAANTWTAVQTFNDGTHALRNPANAFSAISCCCRS